MKHNLKNRPSCETCSLPKLPIPAQLCYDARHKYPSECPKDKWFKDFEAELREEINQLEKEYCIGINCQGILDCQFCLDCHIGGILNKNKEILG